MKTFAEEYSYLANPVAIIDRQVTWYGLPYSAAEFISEGKRIPTFVRPIIRFEGKYTARAVYAVLEMGRKQKRDEGIDETQ